MDLFRKRTKLHGRTMRERSIYKMQDRIKRHALENPSCKKVMVNGEERYLTIVSTENKDTKHFSCMPNEHIERGGIIEWYNIERYGVIKQYGTWMVTSTDSDEDVYQKGIMKRCNYELKWMNENKEIITRPSIISFPYSSLIKENKVYTTDKTKCQIFIPFDKETAKIRADDRFFISAIEDKHTVYRVDNVNDVENTFNGEGYIVLTMSETMLNTETDNTELHICDYYKINSNTGHDESQDKPDEGTNEKKYSKIESDFDYIIPEYVGTNLKAHFFNGDDETSNNVTPLWKVESDNNESLSVTYSSDKKEMTISTDNEELLGKHVKVTLSDSEGIYEQCSLSLLVRGM